MLLRFHQFSPSSLSRNCPFLSLLTKTPSLSLLLSTTPQPSLLLHHHSPSLPSNATLGTLNPNTSMAKSSHSHHLCTASSLIPSPSTSPSNKARKKARRESPEGLLQKSLGICSKNNDLAQALTLYDEARVSNLNLNVHHYNVLLYLCSSNSEGLDRGFEIFKEMSVRKVDLNEASFTSAARLAAAKEDPEMAFDLVKGMKRAGILPRLRSYGPALFGFCKKGMADRAYEVDAHMAELGVLPEEGEIRALLKVSLEAKRVDRVYEMLHRLRISVRQVSEDTAGVVEDWFRSEVGEGVGVENWDVGKVREGVVKGGGGWHGQGWLRSGKWRVARTEMDESGVCRACGEKLVSIDIDPRETENFAQSLTTLACEREVKADFMQFQEWLQWHGPFDAVIDGANVGLVNKHNFSFFELNSVVNKIRQMSPSKKLPLIILHRSRVTGGPAQKPSNMKLLDSWKKSGALYATPAGSNDDWYWLYAAVSSKCLLVTNDEMRDHLFQLLGTSFFPRWKEKHQVRLTFSNRGIAFHMPPPYSIVIQESEQGTWHVPTVTGDDVKTPRQWICATRTRAQPLNQ